MKMAHDTAGCHLADKKTNEKIKFSFTWPTIASDVQKVRELYLKVNFLGQGVKRPITGTGRETHMDIPFF